MEPVSKPALASTTIQGAVVTLLASAGAVVATPHDPAVVIPAVMAGVGALLSIWGRVKATKQIH